MVEELARIDAEEWEDSRHHQPMLGAFHNEESFTVEGDITIYEVCLLGLCKAC